MLMTLLYTLFPVSAAVAGAGAALFRQPGEKTMSLIHHFTAGVIFSAAATEVLPGLKQHSMMAVIAGGVTGVVLMMLIQHYGEKVASKSGMLIAIGIDIFIDGLVLGISFAAGAKTGIMLTLALTLEILFLGLSVVGNLKALLGSKMRVLVAVAGIALLLPIGSMLGTPVAQLGEFWLTYFLSFGLVALLYLVTEELLVEAHKGDRDTPLGTAMFFAGFMILMLIEEGL
ncbi:ZIP family metal transporter [Pantoea sp. JK]|jgi:ZIP family zinc transporter|uniref:ZIP family metal transporter n=1 Tax=Pantoea TaxID=53335 RepID=UPI002237F859|nr:transporter [Pantoea sp. JK]MCW6031776.1 transporter [Pantoea sp. JK]